MDWEKERVHGAFALAYLQEAERAGLDKHQLVSQLRLPPLDLIEQQGVNLWHIMRLTDALYEHTGSTSFAYRAGQPLPATTYGQLSMAMLSAADIGQALETALRYWDLLTQSLALELHMTPEYAEVHVHVHFQAPEPSLRCALEFAVAAVYRTTEHLAPHLAPQLDIDLALPPPDYLAEIQQALPTLRYGQSHHCLRLPRARLTDKMPMANPMSYRTACQECEKLLAIWRAPDRLEPQLQRLLGVFAEGFPPLDNVAARLNMSSRTLRRRLADEGTHFRRIIDDIKQRDALYLLKNSNLEIQQIAEKLGYQDPANFTRAFRKWGLDAPSTLRRQARAADRPRKDDEHGSLP